jgi:hypothetical protein
MQVVLMSNGSKFRQRNDDGTQGLLIRRPKSAARFASRHVTPSMQIRNSSNAAGAMDESWNTDLLLAGATRRSYEV